MSSRTLRALALAATAIAASSALAACGGDDSKTASGSGATAEAATIRLGYFPNITHAPALVGVNKGFFQTALGTTKLETKTFNAGPAAFEALASGAIDAT
jgi:NitT/TauT family transport system substrate-binding protein